MKKILMGAFLVVSMLLVTRANAAEVESPKVEEVGATTGVSRATEVSKNLVESLFNTALKPAGLVKDKFWNPYPHVAGATAAVVGIWAVYKLCPWVREEVFGCTKRRDRKVNLF